jgi:uncharacterized phage protein gp47/JayE
MPFARPQLSDLRTQAAQDIAAALPGSDPLLRFSNLGIMGTVQAGLAHLHYGYLDWISQQAQPFTATNEFLEAWAALKGVYRLPATSASGAVTFAGTNGTVLPSGTTLVRGDAKHFVTTASGTVASGSVVVPATAVADPGGVLGAFGNTDAGAQMTLGQAVAGLQSNGTVSTEFTGGADIETDDSLRERMLQVYQNPPHGGAAADYMTWALEVPGVTRVWVVPHGFGAGTVVLYVMFDVAEAAHGGFPQGTDGCATGETRDTVATGDQLAVANHIFPLQPVTALVYVVAPIAHTIDFTISGLSGASSDTKNAIAAAIKTVFQQQSVIGASGSTVSISAIEAAIFAVPDTSGFVVTSPTGNISIAVGEMPTLGVITY